MGEVILRKYGVEAVIPFSLYKIDGTALKTDAASASGDITLIRDEAAQETLDADAFVDEGYSYSLTLSVAEMTCKHLIVHVVDQTNPQTWLDKTFTVETYGNASAQHPFDLATATQAVNVTQIGGVAQSATDLKDFADAGYDPATHKVQGLVLADTVTTCTTTTTNTDMVDLSTLEARLSAARAGYLDELAAANIPTDIANVKAETALIVADTNELQTDWHDGGRLDLILDACATEAGGNLAAVLADTNELQGDWVNGGRLDLLLDAVKAVTDTLTLAAIADAVHDEVVDANAPANCNSLRETINVIASAVAGKCSGVDTDTPTFRDLGDTKNRLATTIDANDNRTASTPDGT